MKRTGELRMCDDNLCPYVVTLTVARSVIDDLGEIHDSPEAARGTVVAMRKSAEAVRSCYPCDGPVTDKTGGQVRCPLAAMFSDTHQVATVPVQRQGWAFPPEKLVDVETDSATGQYL